MLKYSTYQSIYNHEMTETGRGGLMDRLPVLRVMLTRRLMLKLLLAVVIISAGCTGMVRVFAGSPQDDTQVEQVVVAQGDTLWEIALNHKPKNMDTRAYIRMIKEMNHLKTSSIQAGDVLSLPIY